MLKPILVIAGLVLLLGAAWLAFGADRLQLFNRLVPKDGGAQRVARDLAYGGDPRQRLDIYAPRRPIEGDQLPVILFIHGGGWHEGYKSGYEFVGRALAARGFVAVVINYRLVPAVRFPAFVEDGSAAVRWVRAHVADYGGDGERIVLAGHSAGAQIVGLLAMDDVWLGEDRAAIAGWVGLAGPYDFLPLDSPLTIAAFGEADDLAATQPINFAGAGDPPALLATGDDDSSVKPRNSIVLAGRLEDAGVPVTLRRYPGIGHIRIVTALSRWTRGSAPVLDDMTAFARRVTERERRDRAD